ncbi:MULTISPECIES: retron system putative HNH endonuclease [Pseudomonas]|uniref:retron system putative HNH endonuclease n=1 Tax=Pseudomonas TaxID=286 RepID=UPI002D21BEDE|nr:retron system putative HNH endonuclease [Pseudomonas sp. LY10J]
MRKTSAGPFQLARSHAEPPLDGAAATSRWKSFGYKAEVLSCLLQEQYALCCYSEIRASEVGLGFHIEHVENKSQRPARTFDYANLAASALSSENDLNAFKAMRAEVFGGHALGKSKGVDMARFIFCHQADCSRFFTYLSDGRVVPADGLVTADVDRARYTIELLNLNSPYLLTLRQQWWEELESVIEAHITHDMDLQCLACIDLVPRNEVLSPFFSITRAVFGRVAEDVLTRYAPELL